MSPGRFSPCQLSLKPPLNVTDAGVSTKKPSVFAGLLVSGDQPPEGSVTCPRRVPPLSHPQNASLQRCTFRSPILPPQACYLFGNLAPRPGGELSILVPTSTALLVKSRAASFLHPWVWR
ncbi:hypothetical protein BV22DRAFT_7425 [Leucogyrophana mollusca]|uniref:Uncharacterized protein n=1 Tax=Leucogyrophana mollusca TaxID=85980 RepID=A0ACB8BZ40_9AGAM|nr:hypothetical protein BV22DRAFT_7425 [Leucogyrophana mollusca]